MTGNFIKISEDLRGYGVQPFEGPLDLLLYLIKQDEIDIYDIPIAKITGQYLAYLEAMKELDLEIAGEFILMASMLIRIKAQMLLPRPEPDEIEVTDPRSELVAALIEYKRFKQAAEELETKGRLWSERFSPGNGGREAASDTDYILRKVDISALMIAFGEVVRKARTVVAHHVQPDEVLMEDRIRYIADRLSAGTGVEFIELFNDDPRRIVLVVTFVAILELARLGQITLQQSANFGKIWVYPANLNVEEAIRLYAENV